MTEEFKNNITEAMQFVLTRIQSFEIEEQRTYFVEPRILKELSYYIARTWEIDKKIKEIDTFYMRDRIQP